jgi:hypothetical protein
MSEMSAIIAFWKLFIEEKANAEQIIQLSHTM